jgi:dolichol-phosphate mannosyltransferase
VLPELLRRTREVLANITGGPHEIVLVDDGSSDRTLEMLEAEAARDPRIVVVALSRNFGHQAGLTAALDYCSGDAVVVMDADLQDVPEAIPLFVEQYQRGYEVVYATRARRKEAWWLRLAYFLFYRLVAMLSQSNLPLDAGDFALISRRVVEQLRRLPEHHRYLRGLRSWVGFRQIGIPVDRAERYSGQSKYSLRKLFELASDGIFAFSIVPLRAATLLGTLAVVLSGVFAVYSVYAKFFLHRSPQGFTALVLLITFLSGILLFFLGIIGEYVGRLYEEVKARPHYIISQTLGWPSPHSREKRGPGSAPESGAEPQETPSLEARTKD